MAAPIPYLASIDAALNGLAVIFLGCGFYFIRRRNIKAHRFCMITAFVISALFLACYLAYHFEVGDVRFGGQGAVRPVYFTVLISHIILAALVPPLAIITLVRALRARFDAHRRIARFTWPIWIYVSITGVVVYVMVYIIYGPARP